MKLLETDVSLADKSILDQLLKCVPPAAGAFLIPYWVMLFAEGLPLFLLELAVGQRLRKGAIGVWKQVSPYLGGIGIASGVVSFNVALYYNTIIAWCLNYFIRVSVWTLSSVKSKAASPVCV